MMAIWPPTLERLGSVKYDWFLMESTLKVIHKTSICASLTLIQFKVVITCHYSKTKLAQIFPNTVDVYDRCGGSLCSLAHMLLSCPALTIFGTMSKVFSRTIDTL